MENDGLLASPLPGASRKAEIARQSGFSSWPQREAYLILRRLSDSLKGPDYPNVLPLPMMIVDAACLHLLGEPKLSPSFVRRWWRQKPTVESTPSDEATHSGEAKP
jgi:hypothetical protein